LDAAFVLQFGIDRHFHRRNATLRNEHVDRRGRHRLDRIQRRIVGAARDIRRETELFAAAGPSAANHFSNWPSRSLRASPSPRP
jgi:hypothetical protein